MSITSSEITFLSPAATLTELELRGLSSWELDVTVMNSEHVQVSDKDKTQIDKVKVK